jgi:hypothetical protein
MCSNLFLIGLNFCFWIYLIIFYFIKKSQKEKFSKKFKYFFFWFNLEFLNLQNNLGNNLFVFLINLLLYFEGKLYLKYNLP